MREKKKSRRFMTTTQAARLAQISPSTLLRSIRTQKLAAFSTPGGHFRIDPDSLRAFLKKSGLDVSEKRKVLVVRASAADAEKLLRDMKKDDGFSVVDEKSPDAPALKDLPPGAVVLLLSDASPRRGASLRNLKKLVF